MSRIGVAEAYHGLVATGRHLLQELVHGRPVIDVFLLAYVAVQHIGELQLHIFLFDRAAGIPQYNARHGLHVGNL